MMLDNGKVMALSAVGEFTIRRLRLNRGLLVEYRKQRKQNKEQTRLLQQYQDLLSLLAQANGPI